MSVSFKIWLSDAWLAIHGQSDADLRTISFQVCGFWCGLYNYDCAYLPSFQSCPKPQKSRSGPQKAPLAGTNFKCDKGPEKQTNSAPTWSWSMLKGIDLGCRSIGLFLTIALIFVEIRSLAICVLYYIKESCSHLAYSAMYMNVLSLYYGSTATFLTP